MGVPGLWDVLNEVGKVISIAKLATIDGFQENHCGRRAYRVGIDVSIWFELSKNSKEGDNPSLRYLFYKLVWLSKLSIIPLFVFDGRERPKVKRGSKMGKSGSHPLSRPFKDFLDAFGIEWREAPGEAEAELAFLNQAGHIDAVLTDDCDAFVFGAHTVMKNPNNGLSGNKKNPAKNSSGKTDEFHTWILKSSDIASSPQVSLKRGGLVLFALLSGGDYDKGVHGVGKGIAHQLARSGLGEDLLQAFQNLPEPIFMKYLPQWRLRAKQELTKISPRTKLPETFPPLEAFKNYAMPFNSGSKHGGTGSANSLALRDKKNMNIAAIAGLCEKYFEWGTRNEIIYKFSNSIWPGAVLHVLRRSALEMDENERLHNGYSEEIGTPASLVGRYLGGGSRIDRISEAFVNRGPAVPVVVPSADNVDHPPLILRIVRSREHTSTDSTTDYRVEIQPNQLVQLANSGITGKRPPRPPKEGVRLRKEAENPNTILLQWIPAVIMERVHPTLVNQYHSKQSIKGQRKAKAKERASSPWSISEDNDSSLPAQSSQASYSVHASQATLSAYTSLPFVDKTNLGGFSFTFDDPDSAQFDNCIHIEEYLDGTEEEDDQPKTAFEVLCDRIILEPTKSSGQRKRKAQIPEIDVGVASASDAAPKKKRKSLLLDRLDEVNFV